MENPTKIMGEPGKQELFNIREFDAPKELVLEHSLIQIFIASGMGPEESP